MKGDNTGSISLVENNQVNDRSKHIDVHYHKIREEFQKGTFELFHIESKDNLADIFTKILPKPTVKGGTAPYGTVRDRLPLRCTDTLYV